MADKALAVVDPSGRLISELAPLAAESNIALLPIRPGARDSGLFAPLGAPALPDDLGPPPAGSPPRWIVGDAGNPARLAGAAAKAGAGGGVLAPGAGRGV